MAGILSEILDRKRETVARLRADAASRDLRDRALATRAKATPHPLLRAFESNSARINIIAEFKRRSVNRRREGPAENARTIRAILNSERDGDLAVARDLVVINTAAALYLADVVNDFQSAAAMARESIDSGHAASKLEALIRETNRI